MHEFVVVWLWLYFSFCVVFSHQIYKLVIVEIVLEVLVMMVEIVMFGLVLWPRQLLLGRVVELPLLLILGLLTKVKKIFEFLLWCFIVLWRLIHLCQVLVSCFWVGDISSVVVLTPACALFNFVGRLLSISLKICSLLCSDHIDNLTDDVSLFCSFFLPVRDFNCEVVVLALLLTNP